MRTLPRITAALGAAAAAAGIAVIAGAGTPAGATTTLPTVTVCNYLTEPSWAELRFDGTIYGPSTTSAYVWHCSTPRSLPGGLHYAVRTWKSDGSSVRQADFTMDSRTTTVWVSGPVTDPKYSFTYA